MGVPAASSTWVVSVNVEIVPITPAESVHIVLPTSVDAKIALLAVTVVVPTAAAMFAAGAVA